MSDRRNAPEAPQPLTPEDVRAYLEYSLAGLMERRAEILAALAATAAAYDTIPDDEALGQVAENLRMADALLRTAEARREELKRPFLAGGRAIDAWFKTFGDALTAPRTSVQWLANEYGRRQLEAARAKAAEAEAATRRQADAALAEARDALESGADASVVQATLDEAAAMAEDAERARLAALASPADMTRTRGDFGAVASVRRQWKWEVADADQVPRAFMSVDPAKVAAALKAAPKDAEGRPTLEIPGIVQRQELKMAVR